MRFPSSISETLLHLAEPPTPVGVGRLGNILTLHSTSGPVLVVPIDEKLDQDALTEVFGECTLVRLSATFYRVEKDT